MVSSARHPPCDDRSCHAPRTGGIKNYDDQTDIIQRVDCQQFVGRLHVGVELGELEELVGFMGGAKFAALLHASDLAGSTLDSRPLQ